MILEVKTPFNITTTKEGEVWAKVGDKLKVEERTADVLWIRKLNDQNIYSTWKNKNYILSYCKKCQA